MMWSRTGSLLAAAVLSGVASAITAAAPTPLFDPARDMRVADVHPGMAGYGLTVLHGTTIDAFDVRVESVLHDFNPKGDVVLVTFGGHGLEHTTAIAGMSGSPIYLYDPAHPGDRARAKLLGAFAYGWQFQKDPIGGVQPIEYMLGMSDGGGGSAPPPAGRPAAMGRSAGPALWSLFDRLARPAGRGAASPLTTMAGDGAPRLVPLATPLMVAGLSPRVLGQAGPLFAAAGLVPMQAGGASAGDATADDPIVPGSVLGIPLVTGDIDMTAIGTCTDVVDGHVVAFGHPLNGDGRTSLPFCGGQIQGVIACANSSFKIGSVSRVQGTLTQDQTVGIGGTLGKGPGTVPVQLRVVYADGSEDQTYHFDVVDHPKLTPLLVATGLSAAMTGAKDLPAHHTVDYDLTMEFANGQQVRVADAGVDLSPTDLFAAVGVPLEAAADNPFGQVPARRITGTLTVSADERSAQILYAAVPRSRYKPGEVVTAYVTYRPFRGDERTLPASITLPRDLPDATYKLTVADAATYLDDERTAEPFRFTAETTAEVFDVLRDALAIRHDAVYLRLLRQPDSVSVGHVAMDKLPGSRRQILVGSGRSDVLPFASSARTVVPAGRVMTGSADFEITVDHNADGQQGAGR